MIRIDLDLVDVHVAPLDRSYPGILVKGYAVLGSLRVRWTVLSVFGGRTVGADCTVWIRVCWTVLSVFGGRTP